jgi:hypothetical protein
MHYKPQNGKALLAVDQPQGFGGPVLPAAVRHSAAKAYPWERISRMKELKKSEKRC